jgi:hypothetical protein
MDIDPKTLEQTAPGLAGAIGAIFFMRGPWLVRVGLVIPGGAAAHYGAVDIARLFGMSVGLAAFSAGLLSMIVVSKVVDTWNDLALGTLVADWLRKLLGLQQKGGDQ